MLSETSLPPSLLSQSFFELLYLSAALAYNHAGLCAENVDVDSLELRSISILGTPARSKELKEEFTQLVIFNEGIAEILWDLRTSVTPSL